MYHYYNAITNTRGDSLPGYYVRAVNVADNTVASIFSDDSGTPISVVSGVVNMALTDAEGNVSFYIASGNYHVDIYAGDGTTPIKRISNVPMTLANVADALGTSTTTAPSQRAVNDALAGKEPAGITALLAATDGFLNVSGAVGVRDAISKVASMPSSAGVTTLYLGERSGQFRWLSGDRSALVASDPQQGLYIAPTSDVTGASGCWARVWDGVNGRPEWFGAVGYPVFEDWAALSSGQKADRTVQAAINDTALAAARDLFPVTVLGPHRYYTTVLLKWNLSDRTLTGSGSGYGSVRASIICLVGGAAASSTVFQFGGDNAGAPARGIIATDVGFSRAGATANGSSTGHAEDCVKGVVCQFVTNSEMRRTRVYNSPVGYHITNTGNFRFMENNHETSGCASATNDIIVSFLMGGYSVYGTYVGSNGSLRMEGNDAFNHPASTYTAAFVLYGLIADTWFERCEGAGGKFGMDITALTKTDAITYFAGGGSGGSAVMPNANSGNDVTVHNCRMDGSSVLGFYFHNLNNSTSINLINPYAAGSATQIALNQIDGRVSLIGGELIPNAVGQNGIDVNNVAILTVTDTLIRDMAVPMAIANCNGAKLDAVIYNPNNSATNAIQLTSVSRCHITGAIRGAAGKFTNGINCVGTTCGFNEVDGSRIDYGAMVSVNAAQKVRYNGGDARSGFGTNVLVGVTG